LQLSLAYISGLRNDYHPTKNDWRGILKSQIISIFLAMFFLSNAAIGFTPIVSVQDKNPAFTFADVKYFHRFTDKDQHEYTPSGQEDLKAWTEMVTLLVYRNVKDGEGLAATANRVLETYKANRAVVVKTDSIPRTKDKPAEHLIVVIFGRPEFIEVAFSRFRMYNGLGSAVVFSHRIYGKAVGNMMQQWLEKNGATTETNLMKWDAMPKL
jgi:hypothetical protein